MKKKQKARKSFWDQKVTFILDENMKTHHDSPFVRRKVAMANESLRKLGLLDGNLKIEDIIIRS